MAWQWTRRKHNRCIVVVKEKGADLEEDVALHCLIDTTVAMME